MSITLITGVPGSGKTLYAVSELLRPLVGAVEKKTDERGNAVDIPRTVYTNINGLLLDHQLIEGGGKWDLAPSKDWHYTGNPESLRNWHQWAKPGHVVCFDEFQKFWPPRPNGSAVPPDIQALDTHRHMGVDFILVTQNCMNVDRHIMGLVDRHLHVRRVANMPMAVVYEWDHASKTLNYKNSMTKSPWRYPKGAYKLYKSAELHTKQRRKVPALVWFILAGFAGASFAFPTLKNRLDERINGKAPEEKGAPAAAPVPKVGEKIQYVKDGVAYTVETVQNPPTPIAASSAPLEPLVPATVLQTAGCIVVKDRCSCFDTGGAKVPAPPDGCTVSAGVNGVEKAVILDTSTLATARPGDSQNLAFLRNGRW